MGDTHHEGHLRKRKTSLLRESFLIKIKKKQPTVSTVGYQIKRDQTILMVYLYLLIPIFAKQKIMCCVGDTHHEGHLRKRKTSLLRESFLIKIKKKQPTVSTVGYQIKRDQTILMVYPNLLRSVYSQNKK